MRRRLAVALAAVITAGLCATGAGSVATADSAPPALLSSTTFISLFQIAYDRRVNAVRVAPTLNTGHAAGVSGAGAVLTSRCRSVNPDR